MAIYNSISGLWETILYYVRPRFTTRIVLLNTQILRQKSRHQRTISLRHWPHGRPIRSLRCIPLSGSCQTICATVVCHNCRVNYSHVLSGGRILNLPSEDCSIPVSLVLPPSQNTLNRLLALVRANKSVLTYALLLRHLFLQHSQTDSRVTTAISILTRTRTRRKGGCLSQTGPTMAPHHSRGTWRLEDRTRVRHLLPTTWLTAALIENHHHRANTHVEHSSSVKSSPIPCTLGSFLTTDQISRHRT